MFFAEYSLLAMFGAYPTSKCTSPKIYTRARARVDLVWSRKPAPPPTRRSLTVSDAGRRVWGLTHGFRVSGRECAQSAMLKYEFTFRLIHSRDTNVTDVINSRTKTIQ